MREDSSAMRSPSRSRSSSRRWRPGCGGQLGDAVTEPARVLGGVGRPALSRAPAAACGLAHMVGGAARSATASQSRSTSGGCRGGGWRSGRRLGPPGHSPWYTRFSAPLLARGRAGRPIWSFRIQHGRGMPRARTEGGNEGGIDRVGDVARSRAKSRVNPPMPEIGDFHFFRRRRRWRSYVDGPPKKRCVTVRDSGNTTDELSPRRY